jgi:transcriptional regulator with PAS, ATPase and Fis domain
MDVWARGFPGAITICDQDGIIIDMNQEAANTFKKDGGARLVGKNALDCHPPAAKAKLKALLSSGRTNCYTIEKKGVRKLVYQSPWYRNGSCCGLVELSLEIPEKMPHFVRK